MKLGSSGFGSSWEGRNFVNGGDPPPAGAIPAPARCVIFSAAFATFTGSIAPTPTAAPASRNFRLLIICTPPRWPIPHKRMAVWYDRGLGIAGVPPVCTGSTAASPQGRVPTNNDDLGAATTRENELASLRQAEESRLRISSFCKCGRAGDGSRGPCSFSRQL